MSIHGSMFAGAAARLSPPGLAAGRGAAASFAVRLGLPLSGRYVTRFVGGIVIAMLLAVIAFPAPARAQTITISSVTTSPASVQAGQTVTFTATMTANENLSSYPVLFSLMAPGASAGTNTMQGLDWATFTAGKSVSEAYRWTVPAGTKVGTYTLHVAVYNPAWSVTLAQTTATLAITAAGVTGAPTDMEPPVVSGTAQVGDLLASTTGTWTGAVSYAYQWAGNGAKIAGATAATYAPVSSDTGHTLTSTVTATGSSSATASATSAPTVPIVAASSASNPGSNGVKFTALHTYFMSPTGSDSNNGLTAATAWATPEHAVNCGDVIIAAPGTYNGGFQSWGSVGNCPSTSGGIDGAGGVYFATLLCGGADLGSNGCIINCATGACNGGAAMNMTASNWAVEGWQCNGNGNGGSKGRRCYQVYSTAPSTIYHHVAFINDIAFNAEQAYGGNDLGANHNVPGNGVDYVAVVGMYAQNTGGDTICLGSIDGSGMANSDKNAGTHLIFYNNYDVLASQPSGCGSDGEAFLWDTWDAHGFQGTGVMVNNIATNAARAGYALYYQNFNVGSENTIIKWYNNTSYANEELNTTQSILMEYNLQTPGTALPYLLEIYNNIGMTEYAHQANNASNPTIYALNVGGKYGGTGSYVGGSGLQNIFKGNATSCTGSCDSGDNVETFNGGSFGTNTYVNPAFKNTADLLANRLRAPNCTGFTNTTACLGYNASTSVLTAPSLISDLVPTTSGTAGKGFQLPSTTCATGGVVADYPAWLKGVVYLYWNGSNLTENSDLATKPCKM